MSERIFNMQWRLAIYRSVPDPHRGTRGTCLGPHASRGPAGPLVVHLVIGKRAIKKIELEREKKKKKMKIDKKSEKLTEDRGWEGEKEK